MAIENKTLYHCEKIGQNNKQISVVWIKSVYFSVDLAFENKMKQHMNIFCQSQTNKCRNNKWLLLDLVCRKSLRFLQAKHLQCTNNLGRH